MFSWSWVSFCATAAAETIPTSFTKLESPADLPLALLQTAQGQKIPLSDLIKAQKSPRLLFLHLWAPTCPPCVAEMKTLETSKMLLDKQGAQVITIAEDPDGAISVPAFKKRHSLPDLVTYVDSHLAIQSTLHPIGLPTTYLLSPSGKIIAQHSGAVDWALIGATP